MQECEYKESVCVCLTRARVCVCVSLVRSVSSAGQERFRTLTSSYYRGAHGVALVYDVSSRSSFESLESVWRREVEMYATVSEAVQIVVGNKVDVEDAMREVQTDEGVALARRCVHLDRPDSRMKSSSSDERTRRERERIPPPLINFV